jgi:hypothetical protein
MTGSRTGQRMEPRRRSILIVGLSAFALIGTARAEEVTTYPIEHAPVGSLFESVPSTGVTTLIAGPADDQAREFMLPFGFTFFGTTHFACSPSTNGMIRFVSPSAPFANTSFPTGHDRALFPYWDDLNFVGGILHGLPAVVQYWTSGVAPFRHVTIMWQNAQRFGSTSGAFTFHLQVQLYETTGGIVFSYAVPPGSSGFPSSSYTCGIQGPSGQYQFASPTNSAANSGMPPSDVTFGTTNSFSSPTADAGPDVALEATDALTAVVLDGTGSEDADGDALAFTWTGPFGTATGPTPTVLLGLGVHEVTLLVDDGTGRTDTDTVTVTISDTTAPTLVVTDLPGELWPPNHELVAIRPTLSASDAVDPSPVVSLTVSSSEPDDGTGDGDAEEDIVVDGPGDFALRAERAGKGPGRVYTLVWTVTDSSGNSATATAWVTVPKSRGRN